MPSNGSFVQPPLGYQIIEKWPKVRKGQKTDLEKNIRQKSALTLHYVQQYQSQKTCHSQKSNGFIASGIAVFGSINKLAVILQSQKG